MEMMFQQTRALRSTMTALAINKSLKDIGWHAYEEVCNKLQQYYKCTISDCFDHPQYLRIVLAELYGDASQEIIKSIHNNLGEEANNISTECFLDALSN
jgi:hypothetical protein